MTEILEIVGGKKLSGEILVSGAKNAALPIMMASLLTPQKCTISNVPNIEDVNIALHLLHGLGANGQYSRGVLELETPTLTSSETSYSLVKSLRASFWVLAPLLARGGTARVALPGGDIIGARPVDMHLDALGQMGADIRVKHGVVFAEAPNGLRAARIKLRFPSVGATHQILMAGAATNGATVIENAAREPEVVALAEFLSLMGADIEGAGESELVIRGTTELVGAEIKLIGDRIEAATYLLAVAACQGEAEVRGFNPAHLGKFSDILVDMGLTLQQSEQGLKLRAERALKAVKVASGPFPEFATDIQAPLMAALTLAEGESQIEENVFEGRFSHVSELCRMGARISVFDRHATVTGVPRLTAAPVEAHDIRGAAALLIAALAGEGKTQIFETQHLRRGYENYEQKLKKLGAVLNHRILDAEDYLFSGC